MPRHAVDFGKGKEKEHLIDRAHVCNKNNNLHFTPRARHVLDICNLIQQAATIKHH